MENKELLKQLERELRAYKSVLGKAADSIRNHEVSEYPIFIVHQGEIELGIPVIEKAKAKGNWSINASFLEDFAAKSLIVAERIEHFQGIYKDPTTHLCLFVLSEIGANFIFLPRN